MTKRKIDSSLDGIIVNYLKKTKFEKSMKLLKEKFEDKYEDAKVTEKFLNYLRAKEAKKEIESDDLGFEINFGAYQSQPKVSRRNPDQMSLSDSQNDISLLYFFRLRLQTVNLSI